MLSGSGNRWARFMFVLGRSDSKRFVKIVRTKIEARKTKQNRDRLCDKSFPGWGQTAMMGPHWIFKALQPQWTKVINCLCYICDLKAQRLGRGYFPAESSPAHQAGGCSGGGWRNPSTKRNRDAQWEQKSLEKCSEWFLKRVCPNVKIAPNDFLNR